MFQILIVDDEPIVKIALRSILPWEEHGFKICATASNGQEALKLVQQYQPHIVITDLKMPIMDGISFIQALKEQDYFGEILVLSNYEDFEYVRNALVLGAADYMLKVELDAKHLLKQLQKTVQKLKEKMGSQTQPNASALFQQQKTRKRILKDFFMDDISIHDFLEKHAQFDFSFIEDPCSLCYISFERYILNQDNKKLSASLIKNTIKDALQGQENFEIISLNKYNLLILLPQKDLGKSEQSLYQLVQKLPNRFQLYQSLSPVIIYYWNAKDYGKAREILNTTSDMLLLEFYENLTLLNANEIHLQHYLNFIQYKGLAIELRKSNLVDWEKSISLLTAIIDNCRQNHVYPEILRLLFSRTLDFMEYLAKDISIHTHEFLMEEKETILLCTNCEELLSHMILSMQTMFAPAGEQDADTVAYRKDIEWAITYIHNHYQEKITLATIAESVNLSPNYLCRLFKTSVGTSLTNYINSLRMEKAAKIMEKYDYSIKEVSIRVGIEDQLYFSRMFKKHFGVPPSAYKRRA